MSLVPYAQKASAMRLPILSEASIQNLNLLSQKLWVLWLRGCFGAVKGPLGAAHGGVLGPICSGVLHHAAPLPFRCFDTKFEPSMSKTLGFMAWGCFGAVKGPLGAAHGGILVPIRSGGLHHAAPLPFRGFDTKFEPSISKTLGFMA